MTPEQLKQKLEAKMQQLQQYANKTLLEAIAGIAVDSFKENFDNEAFNGEKWKDVKRRDPNSKWYGFEWRNTEWVKPPKSKRRRKKDEPKPEPIERKNFNSERTTAKILHGENEELKRAIRSRIEPGRVIIANEKPYARVHNYGEQAKVFGKHPFQMPKRQFMGVTDNLKKSIKDKIKRDINNILNS
jgi:phage virion morphogenesis protein